MVTHMRQSVKQENAKQTFNINLHCSSFNLLYILHALLIWAEGTEDMPSVILWEFEKTWLYLYGCL